MAAVEHVGDLVDLLGSWGGIAGGGPQVDVPEPGRDGSSATGGIEPPARSKPTGLNAT
jgi:hypothetical protein